MIRMAPYSPVTCAVRRHIISEPNTANQTAHTGPCQHAQAKATQARATAAWRARRKKAKGAV